jgi:hypothetical protein
VHGRQYRRAWRVVATDLDRPRTTGPEPQPSSRSRVCAGV